jgi:hypothetical protein
MRPANFPGRVNARRMVAFSRLSEKFHSNEPYDAELFNALSSRIMTDEHARSIRTKKRRESP